MRQTTITSLRFTGECENATSELGAQVGNKIGCLEFNSKRIFRFQQQLASVPAVHQCVVVALFGGQTAERESLRQSKFSIAQTSCQRVQDVLEGRARLRQCHAFDNILHIFPEHDLTSSSHGVVSQQISSIVIAVASRLLKIEQFNMQLS